jgi:hypothetical protein
MEDTYYKTFEDLNRRELVALYDHQPAKTYPPKYPITDKSSLVINILALNEDFFPTGRKFFFKSSIDTGFIEYLHDYDTNGQDVDQKFAKEHHKMDIVMIKAGLEATSMQELLTTMKFEPETDNESLPDLDISTDDDVDPNATVINNEQKPKPNLKQERAEAKTKNRQQATRGQTKSTFAEPRSKVKRVKISNARLKCPKYDLDLDISAWLRNLEIYGRVSRLDDEQLIQTALSSMLGESEGSHIISSLEDSELRSWPEFKAKLEDVLGNTRDHWKFQFENYQRGSDSFGVAMAKLTSYYKQGYGIKELRQNDEELLIERFCVCQDDKMRELLLREKANLNVSTIAKRANELYRSLPRRENLFAISTTSETSDLLQQIKDLKEEFEKLKTENSQSQKKFKPKDNRKKSKIDLDRAQGYCIKYTNSKDCRYGSDCKYIHSNEVPKSVADYAKSLL